VLDAAAAESELSWAGNRDGAACCAAALRAAGAGMSTLRSTVGADEDAGADAEAAAGTRVLCHHAPPRTSTAATSATMTPNAQRGICGGGAASGTCDRPGVAERCRSCSDLRSASRMNDTSVILHE
jgi:hypothetical protein